MEMVDFLLDAMDRRRLSRAEKSKYRKMFKTEYRALVKANRTRKRLKRAWLKAKRVCDAAFEKFNNARQEIDSTKRFRKSQWRRYVRKMRQFKWNNGIRGRKMTKAEKKRCKRVYRKEYRAYRKARRANKKAMKEFTPKKIAEYKDAYSQANKNAQKAKRTWAGARKAARAAKSAYLNKIRAARRR